MNEFDFGREGETKQDNGTERVEKVRHHVQKFAKEGCYSGCLLVTFCIVTMAVIS